MAISPLAGKPAPKEMLVDLSRLKREYFDRRPDPDDPAQRVAFGTSRHRGSPLHGSFNAPQTRPLAAVSRERCCSSAVSSGIRRLGKSGALRPCFNEP